MAVFLAWQFSGDVNPEHLNDPSAGGMSCDLEMQHASAIMADDEEAVECAERQRWNSEEIHRGDDFPMIAQEA